MAESTCPVKLWPQVQIPCAPHVLSIILAVLLFESMAMLYLTPTLQEIENCWGMCKLHSTMTKRCLDIMARKCCIL